MSNSMLFLDLARSIHTGRHVCWQLYILCLRELFCKTLLTN
nr:MAG TPA: hypothetical protein [Caudoviricetes sp.]